MKRFGYSSGIIAPAGGHMYTTQGGTIQKMTYDGKDELQLTYFAGDKNYSGYEDGDLAAAKFNNIISMKVLDNGDIYLADIAGALIKRYGGIQNEKLVLEEEVPAKLRTNGSWDYWCIIRKISNGRSPPCKTTRVRFCCSA